MRLFLLVFFLLYGALHLYAFLKARAALAFGTKTGVYLALFMAIMVLAPVIVRLSEKQGLELFARAMSYIGYTWMGALFLYCSASIAIDLYRLIVHVAGFILQRDLSALSISMRYSFLIAVFISLTLSVYGYFEAKNIRNDRIVIRTPKLPEQIGRLTIAQISDVHLGLIVREERLKGILEMVKRANPDIFVATGDLVDGQINRLEGLAELFQEINPRYGKFAVTGNHEFYAGLDQALDFMKRAGFTVLRNEGVTVGGINIAGVDDATVRYYSAEKGRSEEEVLSPLPRDAFTLFLKHKPLIDQSGLGLFDLQLSGHVHKGQIFPFTIATKLYYQFYAGFAKLPKGSSLYVSRGTGTWGPPIRLLAPPEVTIIELVRE